MATIDTLCGLVSVPIGCPLTFIVNDVAEGESVTWTLGGDDVEVGTTLGDANGNAWITLSSAIAGTAEVKAHYSSLPFMSVAWTNPPGPCPVLLVSPVLTATVVGGDDVNLDWTAASHCDARFGTPTYNVLRDGVVIASGLTALTFTDADLPPGEYDYRVAAVWSSTFIGGIGPANSNTETVAFTSPATVSLDGLRYRIGEPASSAVPADGSISLDEVRYRIGDPAQGGDTVGDGINLARLRYRVGEPE